MKPRNRVFVVVTTVVALIMSPSAANADPVDGGRYWSDEHRLCMDCDVNEGNVVAFWQSILIAGGESIGPCPEVDGQFGPYTATNTDGWKGFYGLNTDGIVGELAWDIADGHISYLGDTETYFRYAYVGWNASFRYHVFYDNAALTFEPLRRADTYRHSMHPDVTLGAAVC